jgi:hypothetical protein
VNGRTVSERQTRGIKNSTKEIGQNLSGAHNTEIIIDTLAEIKQLLLRISRAPRYDIILTLIPLVNLKCPQQPAIKILKGQKTSSKFRVTIARFFLVTDLNLIWSAGIIASILHFSMSQWCARPVLPLNH